MTLYKGEVSVATINPLKVKKKLVTNYGCVSDKNHFLTKFNCLSKFTCMWGWWIFLMQCRVIEGDQSKDHQEITVVELRGDDFILLQPTFFFTGVYHLHPFR